MIKKQYILFSILLLIISPNLHGQADDINKDERLFDFDLPAKPLMQTLIQVGIQVQASIVAPQEIIEGYNSSPLIGRYSLETALQKILWRTPLGFRILRKDNLDSIVVQIHYRPIELPAQPKPIKSANFKTIEEIVVTGIRASYQTSTLIKRNSNSIIDVITAEDIDKFPDTNLAEALQRVPGVFVSRNNGEGANINIRGLDEQYNFVSLNGRTLPAATAPSGQAADSRAFDYTLIAPEGISSVTVYKTADALTPTGGIGATIDIKTVRPFDLSGYNQYLGVKGIYDTTATGSESFHPELSGLVAWTNDTFGFSLSFIAQERSLNIPTASIDKWLIRSNSNQRYGGRDYLTLINLENGELYSEPEGINFGLLESDTSRKNAQLTLQYAPHDQLEFTLDYTTFKKNTSQINNSQRVLFPVRLNLIAYDNNVIKTPSIIAVSDLEDTETRSNKAGIEFSQESVDDDGALSSLGFNMKWLLKDYYTLTVDAHHSKTTSDSTSARVGAEAETVVSGLSLDLRDKLPLLELAIHDGSLKDSTLGNGFLDSSDIGIVDITGGLSQQYSSASQLRLINALELNNFDLQLGLDLSHTQSNMLYSQTGWESQSPLSTRQETPDHFFTPKNYASNFSDYNTWGMFSKGFQVNSRQVLNWLENVGPEEINGIDAPQTLNYDVLPDKNRSLSERLSSLYWQAQFRFELFSHPATFHIGTRFEHTNQTSKNNAIIPLELIIPKALSGETPEDLNLSNSIVGVRSEHPVLVSQKASYTNTLPNLMIELDLLPNLKTRLAYSKTITRASYSQLESANTRYSQRPLNRSAAAYQRQVHSGNPMLKPISSSNFDISLEWYLSEGNIFSFAYFEKYISDMVHEEEVQKTHLNLRDPSQGSRVEAALQLLSQSQGIETITPADVFAQVAATEYNDPGHDTEYYWKTYDIHANEGDPLAQFRTLTFENSKHSEYSGFELAAQHFFADSGFGLAANYTLINGGGNYDITSTSNAFAFALFGVSDSMNVMALYDKDKLQARLAFNWRGKFLDSEKAVNVYRNYAYRSGPSFTESYDQIDFSLSYQVTDKMSLSLEGINITGENTRRHARGERQLIELQQQGARYQLGLRYAL